MVGVVVAVAVFVVVGGVLMSFVVRDNLVGHVLVLPTHWQHARLTLTDVTDADGWGGSWTDRTDMDGPDWTDGTRRSNRWISEKYLIRITVFRENDKL